MLRDDVKARGDCRTFWAVAAWTAAAAMTCLKSDGMRASQERRQNLLVPKLPRLSVSLSDRG